MAKYVLKVNGKRREISADPEEPLLWILRDKLGLRGTISKDDTLVDPARMKRVLEIADERSGWKKQPRKGYGLGAAVRLRGPSRSLLRYAPGSRDSRR